VPARADAAFPISRRTSDAAARCRQGTRATTTIVRSTPIARTRRRWRPCRRACHRVRSGSTTRRASTEVVARMATAHCMPAAPAPTASKRRMACATAASSFIARTRAIRARTRRIARRQDWFAPPKTTSRVVTAPKGLRNIRERRRSSLNGGAVSRARRRAVEHLVTNASSQAATSALGGRAASPVEARSAAKLVRSSSTMRSPNKASILEASSAFSDP